MPNACITSNTHINIKNTIGIGMEWNGRHSSIDKTQFSSLQYVQCIRADVPFRLRAE